MGETAKKRGDLTASLTIRGEEIPVLLRTHPRARRISIKIKTATREVIIVTPERSSRKQALRFADSQFEWIADRLNELPPRVPFVAGAQIPFKDKLLTIEHAPDARAGTWADEEAGRIYVSGAAEHLERRVHDWLKKEAKLELRAHTERFVEMLEVPSPKITIRDTTSRWGSCSPRSGLSFSWRLILAPSFVLEYVAAHECAHIRHPHHGGAFWREVAGLFPEWKKAERWLNEKGAELHGYGAKP